MRDKRSNSRVSSSISSGSLLCFFRLLGLAVMDDCVVVVVVSEFDDDVEGDEEPSSESSFSKSLPLPLPLLLLLLLLLFSSFFLLVVSEESEAVEEASDRSHG